MALPAPAPPSALHDIAGHRLGTPAAIRLIRDKEDLRAALGEAARDDRPFAAMGERATYWHNLSLEGAIVADLSAYDRVLVVDASAGVATVESGITLRALDAALRAHGSHLTMHPDGYGDTLLGSAIANGVTAGIGMMNRDFLDQIVGFEVMLADGRTLQVGASRLRGGRPGAVARGLPDLRSVFFGAEGALGVVTEVDVALLPALFEARIECLTDDDAIDEVVALANTWRRRGVVDTLRWVWTGHGALSVHLSSPVDEAELGARVERVCATLPGWARPEITVFGDDFRRGVSPGYDAKWPGPAGHTWRGGEVPPFFGLDAVVPYGRVGAAYAWARALRVEAVHRRVACYFGPDGVNLGVHCVSESDAARERARSVLEAEVPTLAALDAVPYRPGLTWRDELASRADPATLSTLRAVARVLDPDGRMNPGVGLFASPSATTKEPTHEP
ncbi:MAG: FAD-binding oxidoreductase [Polyangiaceae bacterium]|nr:FAD-binding oxidoreductase [Polyangiaceae bacterium]